jgi:hypothetical protein
MDIFKMRFFLALAVIAAFEMAAAIPTAFFPNTTVPAAWAEDDEDEEDEEDDEDEDEDRSEDSGESAVTTTKTVMKKVVQEFIEYKPVTRTYVVTDETYQHDTDQDGLVDAIDPDPLVDQRKYFADSDDDGMPDVLDQHPNEDDFLYYESESDENNNGVLDSYEEALAGEEAL